MKKGVIVLKLIILLLMMPMNVFSKKVAIGVIYNTVLLEKMFDKFPYYWVLFMQTFKYLCHPNSLSNSFRTFF